MTIPSVNQVQILGDRDYEISIEVSEHVLRQYGMTMSEISEAIRNSSVDMPGGTIKTDGGDILLRTEGQVYTGKEFGALVLRTFPDGTRLTLADILLYCFLSFGTTVGQALNEDNKNIMAWYQRMAARPSAQA